MCAKPERQFSFFWWTMLLLTYSKTNKDRKRERCLVLYIVPLEFADFEQAAASSSTLPGEMDFKHLNRLIVNLKLMVFYDILSKKYL